MLPPPDLSRAMAGVLRAGPATAIRRAATWTSATRTAATWVAVVGVTVGAISAPFGPAHAAAADTVETWDEGAADLDLYVGLEGMGAANGERSLFGDVMWGYGVMERLSLYLGTSTAADTRSWSGEVEPNVGVFGTLIDSDHVDLDAFLHASAAFGGDASARQLVPSTELNFDLDPDLRSWGAYLRLAVVISHARNPGSDDASTTAVVTAEPTAATARTTVHMPVTVGNYFTLAEGHQALVELDFDVQSSDRSSDGSVDVGGVAVGYNHTLNDTFELISQVLVSLPDARDPMAIGAMIGVIATMPGAAVPDAAVPDATAAWSGPAAADGTSAERIEPAAARGRRVAAR